MMITHYDTVTGEVIGSENHEAPTRVTSRIDETARLQLASQQEAASIETVGRKTPSVVAMLPIAFLLDSAD